MKFLKTIFIQSIAFLQKYEKLTSKRRFIGIDNNLILKVVLDICMNYSIHITKGTMFY